MIIARDQLHPGRIAVAIALFLGGCWLAWWAPADGSGSTSMTPEIGLALGMFAAVGWLWLSEALPLAVTALLVPVIAASCGLLPLREGLVSFAHPLIYLFFGGFALATALRVHGIDRTISNGFVRWGRGRFVPVCLGLFVASAALSMWISNTATVALMLPLGLGVLARLPVRAKEKRRGEAEFLLLGIAYSASIGGLGTVIGSPPNAIAASQLEIGFVEWMRVGIPAMLALLPFMVGVLWITCRPTPGLILEQGETLGTGPTGVERTPGRRRALGIFLVTASCWISSAWLAPRLGIAADFDSLVALAAVVALVATGAVDWREIERGTDWSILLLFGGGLALSAVLGNSGASAYLAGHLAEVVIGWPLVLVFAAVIGLVIFLSELASNTAIAALMVPLFASLAGVLGVGREEIVLPVALAASCAFMLPVATPPNALVFGSGQVTQRSMVRAGFWLNLIGIGLLTALALWVI